MVFTISIWNTSYLDYFFTIEFDKKDFCFEQIYVKTYPCESVTTNSALQTPQVQTSSNTQQIGMSKVFILDKYFNELQKFWDTEKRLKGKQIKNIFITWKYQLCRYILGVLRHTTAWDQHWRANEELNCGFKIDYT